MKHTKNIHTCLGDNEGTMALAPDVSFRTLTALQRYAPILKPINFHTA